MITANTYAQDGFTSDIKEKWENAKSYTLAVLDAMPAEDMVFKPTDDVMTYGEQFVHLSKNMVWLSGTYLEGETIEILATSDKDELRRQVEIAFDAAWGNMEKVTEAQLQDTVSFFAGTKTKRQIMFLIMDHLAHHRGQVVIYLRLRGIKPPRYVGW